MLVFSFDYFILVFIKEKTVVENTGELERNPEMDKRIVEMQTFLLSYLTAKVRLPFVIT